MRLLPGRLALVAAGVLVALLVGGCLPAPATRQASSISQLYFWTILMAAVVGGIVWTLLVLVVIRHRRRRGTPDDELPPQTKGNNLLEVIWTAGPLIAIVILFGMTLLTLNQMNTNAAGDPVQLRVEAYRWGWRMEYPAAGVVVQSTGPGEGPEAVLPVGQPVSISITSADVIHAFFVPQFLYKRDAIPGQLNTFTLTIDEPGTYAGQCAEFCGLYHSQMPFTIRAVAPAEFQAWLSQAVHDAASPVSSSEPSP